MADIIVRTGEVTLRTCKLTKNLLRQFRKLSYQDLIDHGILKGSENKIIGWIDPVAFDEKTYSSTAILIDLGGGDYGLFDAHYDWRKKHSQIYIV